MSQAYIYREITNRILGLLEQGVAPWRKPWQGDLDEPRNIHGGRRYKRFNRLLLSCAGFGCCYWITEVQAQRRGWTVRAGERPWPVFGYFWPPDCFPPRPTLLRSEVYNLLQLDGVIRLPRPRPRVQFPPIERAAAVIEAMPRPPPIRTGFAHACYRPGTDVVEMPHPDRFESVEAAHSTLFHELVHATGHADRVGRFDIRGFGPLFDPRDDYSFEELVAELGAAFLCAHTGIGPKTLDNSAAYIWGWRQRLDANPTWIIRAAEQAGHGVDWILGDHPEVLCPQAPTSSRDALISP